MTARPSEVVGTAVVTLVLVLAILWVIADFIFWAWARVSEPRRKGIVEDWYATLAMAKGIVPAQARAMARERVKREWGIMTDPIEEDDDE